MICKYFLPFSRLPFHFIDGFLCCTECLDFFFSNSQTHFSDDLILTVGLKLPLSRKSRLLCFIICRSVLCPYLTLSLSSLWRSCLFFSLKCYIHLALVFLRCRCSVPLNLLFCLLPAIRILDVGLI